jgi:hypothetical protein
MSPSSRFRAVYRRANRIEDEAVRAQLKLLREMRRALLGSITDATGFRAFHLSQVLASIDREILRAQGESTMAARQNVSSVWRAGVDLADLPLRGILGPSGSFMDLSGELLNAAISVTTEQTTAVWSELGNKLRSTVKRATFGITDPFEAIQQVAKTIKDPKLFGTAEARAEAIIRTEVNRTFSLSSFKRMEQAQERRVEVLKGWLDAGDNRVRPAHAEAAERYGEGDGIPVNKPFIVDGEALMFPGDPRGSAENTINCRCRLWPMVAA